MYELSFKGTILLTGSFEDCFFELLTLKSKGVFPTLVKNENSCYRPKTTLQIFGLYKNPKRFRVVG